jgi:hypothetical protein
MKVKGEGYMNMIAGVMCESKVPMEEYRYRFTRCNKWGGKSNDEMM